MKLFSHQLTTGISFGLTAAVISTLGIIIGLDTATSSRLAVITGIIIMAIADGTADAMGIHLAEESEAKHTPKEIWLSTFFAFVSVFFISLSFLFPVLLFASPYSILISIFWGLGLLSLISFFLAKKQNKKPSKVILEHNLIAIVIIIVTFYLGNLIKNF